MMNDMEKSDPPILPTKKAGQTVAELALSRHPEKTRLIEFGKVAAKRWASRGEGKPETFSFLGFQHYCGVKRFGRGFQLGRKIEGKRMRSKLREIKEELCRRRHASIDEQGHWLGMVVRGYFAYFAMLTNSRALFAFRQRGSMLWLHSLRRRSQRHRLPWTRMRILVDRCLPSARILHPWPERRFLPRKGRHVPNEVILFAVFFYVRYAVSYHDLEEIMQERGRRC